MTQEQKEALRLGTAIHKAIEKLPLGWEISIGIELGSSNTAILLYDPAGTPVEGGEYYDESLAGQIENAIAFAITHNTF